VNETKFVRKIGFSVWLLLAQFPPFI